MAIERREVVISTHEGGPYPVALNQLFPNAIPAPQAGTRLDSTRLKHTRVGGWPPERDKHKPTLPQVSAVEP